MWICLNFILVLVYWLVVYMKLWKLQLIRWNRYCIIFNFRFNDIMVAKLCRSSVVSTISVREVWGSIPRPVKSGDVSSELY